MLTPLRRLPALVVSFAALATAALAQDAVPDRGATELDVAYAPASLGDTYEELASHFEQVNPSVTVNLISAENYDSLAQLVLRNAITDTLPDVAHQGLGLLRTFADNGLAVPLDPFIASEADWHDMGYTDAVEETCTIRTLAATTPGLLGDFYRDNPHHQVAADELGRATVYYNFPGPNSMRVRVTVEEIMLDVLRGDETPENGLRRLREEVSTLVEG